MTVIHYRRHYGRWTACGASAAKKSSGMTLDVTCKLCCKALQEHEETMSTKHYKIRRFDPAGVVLCGVFKRPLRSTMDVAEVNCQRCQAKLKTRNPDDLMLNGKPPVIANGKHNLETLRAMIVEEYSHNGSTDRFEALTAATAAYEILASVRKSVTK